MPTVSTALATCSGVCSMFTPSSCNTFALPQRLLMAWFGIRGIGSVYYLMYAISHGLTGVQADLLVSLTLAVVVASVVAHGISVTPLMRRYEKRRRYLSVWRLSRRPGRVKRLPPR